MWDRDIAYVLGIVGIGEGAVTREIAVAVIAERLRTAARGRETECSAIYFVIATADVFVTFRIWLCYKPGVTLNRIYRWLLLTSSKFLILGSSLQITSITSFIATIT
jgi:hypothetical protein